MSIDASETDLPLVGLRILDFSQYLAGPSCALRLADLGAEVIKIERPQGGDPCRQLVLADQKLGPDSLLFHTINRGKKSVTADLKIPSDLNAVKTLIRSADVMIHNFRPGVMARLGLDVEAVSTLNPTLIQAMITGYGTEGPWRDKPGQDLLVQSRSGLLWLSGCEMDAPVPIGVSITDIAAGQHLSQGILAALLRRERTGKGAVIEVSLLASAMDLQFEAFTSYLNAAPVMPKRSMVSGANVLIAAPYGIYPTADGYLALAMGSITELASLLSIAVPPSWYDPESAYHKRDEIKSILRDTLILHSTSHWLAKLEPAGIWCAEVLDWPQLEQCGALDHLHVIQHVGIGENQIRTTTCPIKIDHKNLGNGVGAPQLGADTSFYLDKFQ